MWAALRLVLKKQSANSVIKNTATLTRQITQANLFGTFDSKEHEKKYDCCGEVTIEREPHEWNAGECTECGYKCTHSGGKGDLHKESHLRYLRQ